MKKLLSGLGLVALVSVPAVAADMPIKAPPAADAYSWSGYYVGFNSGWLRSNIDWTYHNPANGTEDPPLATNRQNTATVGGHAGIQRQFGQVVLGAEVAYFGIFENYGSVPCFNVAYNCWARMDGGAFSAGGRLGFTPVSRWLLFATGGGVNYRVQTKEVNATTGVENQFSTSERRWAPYAGVGFEYAMPGNWIAGVEYQHIFRTSRLTTTSGTPSIEDRILAVDADLVRGRVSYKFHP